MNAAVQVPLEGGGAMDAYRALPPSGHGPVVVILQEIFGANAAIRSVADDLAAQGYVALVPDLFWRLQPGVQLGYGDEDRARALKLWKRFDLAQGVADVVSTLRFARAMGEGTGRAAVLGFCLGGQLAVKAAAGGGADAVVSFYGVRLDESRAEAEALSVPAQFHYGDVDTHFSAEARAMLTGLSAARPDLQLFVYPGAGHGFYNAHRDVSFDRDASQLARGRMLELLRAALAPAA